MYCCLDREAELRQELPMLETNQKILPIHLKINWKTELHQTLLLLILVLNLYLPISVNDNASSSVVSIYVEHYKTCLCRERTLMYCFSLKGHFWLGWVLLFFFQNLLLHNEYISLCSDNFQFPSIRSRSAACSNSCVRFFNLLFRL